VVVFIQGIYTTYDAEGTQGTALEAHRFDAVKAAFVARGYEGERLLDFSYNGGEFDDDGAWQPAPYDCADTDRLPEANLAPLEQMLRDYREEHPNAHFALVGHSLGGYLAFLAGARDAARDEGDRLGIDVVVTLDAPLRGVSADKKTILDLVPCDKTYQAGADLVAARLDPATDGVRAYQAGVMAQAGVRLATLGNINDCLFATARCVGGDWADDGGTQFLQGQASISQAYEVESALLDSHDAILTHAAAIADAVAFVGAP
jgi:pimeloyl-ACP methyl ester carboxylesterase